jgi:light-regulated signal transduction histidine kinase (bacteriophytochrome)
MSHGSTPRVATESQVSAAFDLDNSDCHKEPIHIPGSIQPHGFLLVVGGPDFEVLQASRNVTEFLDRPLHRVLGASLDELLGRSQTRSLHATLEALADTDTEEGRPLYLGTVPARKGNLSVVVHRYDGALILEFEPAQDGEPSNLENIYPLTSSFLAKVMMARTTVELNQMAAVEIRRLTGFDRVLVYQFDNDWHGTVIAEDRSELFPSYLGHRFPASDIPKQARELYRMNRLRLIADATYSPVPVEPADRPDTGRPLDLTYAALRSVSPVHVEYMKNMGTRASMSISIIRDGELWGLICCHHRGRRVVPFLVRAACEFIGQVLSLQLDAREHQAAFEHRIELKSVQARLLTSMAAEDDYRDGLTRDPQMLLSFAAARGAAVIAEDRCTLVGETPGEDEVRRLVAWLSESVREEVFATASLAQFFPEAEQYKDKASGLMAISISKLHPSYVLWFRPEVSQTISWAGNPFKGSSAESEESPRLNPRTSFEIWKETVRLRSLPFRSSEVDAARELRNAIIGIVLHRAEEMAELTGELERSNKELEAFSYSVSHDLRAPFRHIVGFSELLKESARDRLTGDERRYLGTIVEAAHQAGSLVDNLLAYSRMGRQRLDLVRVNMNDLVKELKQEFDVETVGRNVNWVIGPLPEIRCDVMMMRFAIQNLLSNALKFTARRDDAQIEIGAETGEYEHVFFVRDNGVGFDMAYADKLFGIFQRMHRMEDFEGTGIGLANVRRIIARHGGRTWADAAVGQGATIYFSLPTAL